MCALDALGKWSLLDFALLMMMAVAFRLQLDVPAAAHAHAHAPAPAASSALPLQASLEVTAQFGMFGFLAACVLSLATSHVLLALQRRAAAAAVAAARAQSAASVRGTQLNEAALPGRARLPPRRPLRSYRFRLPWAEGAPRVLCQRTQLAMVLLLGACALTILCGACVDTFSVRIGGLAVTLTLTLT